MVEHFDLEPGIKFVINHLGLDCFEPILQLIDFVHIRTGLDDFRPTLHGWTSSFKRSLHAFLLLGADIV